MRIYIFFLKFVICKFSLKAIYLLYLNKYSNGYVFLFFIYPLYHSLHLPRVLYNRESI